jgi:hypothetical protein
VWASAPKRWWTTSSAEDETLDIPVRSLLVATISAFGRSAGSGG